MAVKTPPLLYAWTSVVLLWISWVVMLGGVGSLQANCGGSGASELLRAGSAGYLAPVSCHRFYSYIWWTLWYDFMALVLLSYVLAKEIVHITRYFVIAFLAPLTYLLMSTTDVAQAIWHLGVSQSRAKALFAGTIMSTILQLVMIILLGIQDELKV
ncbi:hypothetical protein QBZ16_005325 [Prototheca wickerhamii]|uniref:Uncharacterized protein n=1 Tax=Prototheca wickerhamii TaxID=3111 RepID=A0AAD9IH69_PROWI|nr:hypothetical protein QBZ16_005325 [Prototheca wickerhamii]